MCIEQVRKRAKAASRPGLSSVRFCAFLCNSAHRPICIYANLINEHMCKFMCKAFLNYVLSCTAGDLCVPLCQTGWSSLQARVGHILLLNEHAGTQAHSCCVQAV